MIISPLRRDDIVGCWFICKKAICFFCSSKPNEVTGLPEFLLCSYCNVLKICKRGVNLLWHFMDFVCLGLFVSLTFREFFLTLAHSGLTQEGPAWPWHLQGFSVRTHTPASAAAVTQYPDSSWYAHRQTRDPRNSYLHKLQAALEDSLGFPPLHQAIPWHQAEVLQFVSLLTLSPQREQQVPQGKGSVPPDGPHSGCQTQVQGVASASDRLAINQRFPRPLRGFD